MTARQRGCFGEGSLDETGPQVLAAARAFLVGG
jgi:hypothetical protein